MRKSQIYGIIGSAISCGIILLLLFVIKLSAPSNMPQEEGIVVSFGESEEDMGRGKEQGNHLTFKGSVPQQISSDKNEKLLTQSESSVALSEQKNDKRQSENISEQEELRKKRENEAIEKANVIATIFGNRGSSEGGSGNGNILQGNPAGKGVSNGHGWSLSGRDLVGGLVTPRYEKNVEGKITVNIRVDENGKVVGASIGSPTTISDTDIRKAAIEAALNTRFTAGKGMVSGTVTYNFKLK